MYRHFIKLGKNAAAAAALCRPVRSTTATSTTTSTTLDKTMGAMNGNSNSKNNNNNNGSSLDNHHHLPSTNKTNTNTNTNININTNTNNNTNNINHDKDNNNDDDNNNINNNNNNNSNDNNNPNVKSFSILTYNILGKGYEYRYKSHCVPEVLNLENRSKSIANEVFRHNPDIVCLQELTEYNEFFKPTFEERPQLTKYKSCWLKRPADTTAGKLVVVVVKCFFF